MTISLCIIAFFFDLNDADKPDSLKSLGACGYQNTSSNFVVALSSARFNGGNPNKDPICNKTIQVASDSKSVNVMVVDKCAGCNVNDLLLSPAAFSALADLNKGHMAVNWSKRDFTGGATYFFPDLGACGYQNTSNDFVAALSSVRFDRGNPNKDPICNKMIQVTCDSKSVNVMVVDKCAGCNANDLLLSPIAFSALADLSKGQVAVNWVFLS
ncbi:Non-catalytic module family EXPN protein [Gigaspora margarita]|uniref:Non-catalytic module family EXPN protein n=1 Tax=Gigaspora margarita TaxID=4874 RepID=A0A8H4EJM1_GIGMA|nr:Non-catalytic module family EXPN protein [Gigaspora margarita]